MSRNKAWAVVAEGKGSLFVAPDAESRESLSFTVVNRAGDESHVFISPGAALDLSEWLKAWACEAFGRGTKLP